MYTIELNKRASFNIIIKWENLYKSISKMPSLINASYMFAIIAIFDWGSGLWGSWKSFLKTLMKSSPRKCLCLHFNTFYWLPSLLFICRVKNLVNSQGKFSPAFDIIIQTSPQRGAGLRDAPAVLEVPELGGRGGYYLSFQEPGEEVGTWPLAYALCIFLSQKLDGPHIHSRHPRLFYPPPTLHLPFQE